MKNTKKPSNNISHPLRLIAGVYLVYLAYSLIKSWADLDNKPLFTVFIAIFGIIGLLLLATSGLALLRERGMHASGPRTPEDLPEELHSQGESATDQEPVAEIKEEPQENSKDQSE